MNRLTQPRRTQQERREETMGRLMEAARETLIELGYAKTSVQQICRRAGVSQGGLFRHFDTRLDLLIAVARNLSNDLIDHYDARFKALKPREADPFRLALNLLRDNCRAHANEAWFELILAARSDATLRQAMIPIWQENRARTRERAMALFPELVESHPDFAVFVDCLVDQFHGETINRFIQADEDADQDKLECTLGVVRRYAGESPG